MKALPTQFGDQSFSGAVATPTCSSCCCCCCCLATTVVGSIAVAQTAKELAQKRKLPKAEVRRVTIMGALVIPVVVLLVIVMALVLYPALDELFYASSFNPLVLLVIASLVIFTVLLAAVFKAGSGKTEVARSVGVVTVLAGAFFGELVIGMNVLFSSSNGGVVYLMLVSLLIMMAVSIIVTRNARSKRGY